MTSSIITTVLISLHALTATLIFSAAALIILADPKDSKNRAIGSILLLFSLSSIAFGLGFNSTSIQQAAPWILMELVATYSAAPAAVLVALIVLRPKIAKNLYVTIPLWLFILLPPVIGFFDILNISQSFFSRPVFLSFEKLAQNYIGGYFAINDVSTTFGNIFLQIELVFFYTLLIFYPSLYVSLKDRKTDRNNSFNGTILFVTSVTGSVIFSIFNPILPITTAPLLLNAVFSVGFFIIGIRIIQSRSQLDTPSSWLQAILKNYSMFTKLMTTIGLIVIPSIIFISFSSFSYFQNSLLTIADDNLQITVHHGAETTNDFLNDELHSLVHLNESRRAQALMAARGKEYSDLTNSQIRSLINDRNSRWLGNDLLFISTTLSPDRNNELEFLLQDTNFLSLILVDPYGGMITGSGNPALYDYSNNEAWTFAAKEQKTFIGQLEWNDETQSYLLEIGHPLFNLNNELTGVVLAEYNATTLLTNLQKFEQNNTQFGFVNSNGKMTLSSGLENAIIDLPVVALESQPADKTWRTIQINDEANLLKVSQDTNPEMDFTKSWRIAAFQPVSKALAPLSTATYTAVITAGIIITISTIIIISLSQSISGPIRKLTEAAKKILEGDTDISLEVQSADEIGTLATSFNQMTTDLNALVNNLEVTIEARTKDLQQRAVQLEASALVARQAAEVRDVTTLLELVVNLIPKMFNYYHAGIFLLDEHNRFAILQAANSDGGKKMLARNHKLQVGRVGVVGFAAGMGEPRIAQDVGADVVYYDNPDMPDTRSEMAVPLKVRERVIGVLDVQSTEANAFAQEDIEILQVLADQVALAIDNARLLENSQKALEELQILYGQDTAKAWRTRLTGKEIAYTYDSTGLTRQSSETNLQGNDSGGLLSKPISLRGQIIGNLNFLREGSETGWSDDENILIEEILEQTALALENARLVNQIRLRSDQIQLLQEITSTAASVLDEKELLDIVAEKLYSNLQVLHCGIGLFDNERDNVQLVSSVSSPNTNLEVGRKIRIEEDPVTQLIIKHPEITVLQEIEGEPQYQAFVQTFTTKKSASLILLPITSRDQTIGYIFFENEDKDRRIDLEEENLFRQIAGQISTAVEAARLFAAEQEGRIAAAALLEITQIAAASLDMNQVLNQATNRSAQAIQAHRCTIFLLDEVEKIKPLISIYADGSEMPQEEWDILQKRVKETYEDIPLHRLAANLRTPKVISNPLAYQAIPLSWTGDFHIENLLMVPLISQNKVIGSMIFDQVDRNLTFKQNQAELAQTIAGQIATTIENANLFEQAVRRAERERQVTEITAKIRSSNDPEEIMETAITELRMALIRSSEKVTKSTSKKIADHGNNLPTNGKDKAQN